MKALPRRLAHAMYLLACEYHVIYKNRMYFMAMCQDHTADGNQSVTLSLRTTHDAREWGFRPRDYHGQLGI